MRTKSISSTQIQNNFGRILDDIVQNGTQYVVQRRGAPQAIILSLNEFESLLASDTEQARLGHIIRELSPEYNLGDEIE